MCPYTRPRSQLQVRACRVVQPMVSNRPDRGRLSARAPLTDGRRRCQRSVRYGSVRPSRRYCRAGSSTNRERARPATTDSKARESFPTPRRGRRARHSEPCEVQRTLDGPGACRRPPRYSRTARGPSTPDGTWCQFRRCLAMEWATTAEPCPDHRFGDRPTQCRKARVPRSIPVVQPRSLVSPSWSLATRGRPLPRASVSG